MASIALIGARRYAVARITAALAAATVLCGWAGAQYPYVLPSELTIAKAAAGRTALAVMLVALVIGGTVLLPALAFRYVLFQRSPVPGRRATGLTRQLS